MVRRSLSVVIFVFLFILSACNDGEQTINKGKTNDQDDNNITDEVDDTYLEEIEISSYQESVLSEYDEPVVIGYMSDNKVLIHDQGLWKLHDGENTYQTTELAQAQGYFVAFDPETNTVSYANPITDRVSEFDLDSDMTYGELSETFFDVTYQEHFVSPTMILHDRILYGTDTSDLFPLESRNIIYVNLNWNHAIWAKDTGDGQCNINLYEDVDDITPVILEVSDSLNCGEFQYMKGEWRVYSLYDTHESSYEGYVAISKTGDIHTYFPDEHVPDGIQKDFNSEDILYNGRLRGVLFTYEENNILYYVVTSPDLSTVRVFTEQELQTISYFDNDMIAKQLDNTIEIFNHQDTLLYTYSSPFEQMTSIHIVLQGDYILLNETNTFGHNMDIIDKNTFEQVFTGAYFGYGLFDGEIYLRDESDNEYYLDQNTWTTNVLDFNSSEARRYITGNYFYQIIGYEVSIYEKDGTHVETHDILAYMTREESHRVLVKEDGKYFIIG